MVFKLLNIDVTLTNLIYFNFSLHLMTVIGIFLLTNRLLSLVSAHNRLIGATVLSIGYIFTTETLFSHGVIYWSHSLFQVFYVAYLLFIVHILTRSSLKTVYLLVNAFICFTLASIDWTGYLVALISGIVLYILAPGPRNAKAVLLASSWMGMLAAFVYLAGTFLSLVPLSDWITALQARFLARSYNSSIDLPLAHLFMGYFESFTFAVTLLIGLVLFIKRSNRNPILLGVTMITAFAMLENILMLQHALAYAYDRLKLFLLLIPGFVLLWENNLWAKVIAFSACLVTIILAVIAYGMIGTAPALLDCQSDPTWIGTEIGMNDQGKTARRWDVSNLLADNEKMRSGLPVDDVVLGTCATVRGYVNVDWNHSIYEYVTPTRVGELAGEREIGRWIYMSVAETGNHVYRYTSILYGDHGNITLRYVDDQSQFSWFNCDPMENGSRVYECTEEQLRAGLDLLENPQSAADDSHLLTALTNGMP